MSPGPDFAIVTRYGLSGSRRAAIMATAGISSALVIHILYCLMGIVVVLESYPWLFSLIQSAGALYLAYLGVKLLLPDRAAHAPPEKKRLGQNAFAVGFLTNLLNPKASLFLLSLFAEFITPSTPLLSKIVYGVLVPLVAFSWFLFLSIMLTHRHFLPHLQRYQAFFLKAMGCLLLLLAGWVLFSAISHGLAQEH